MVRIHHDPPQKAVAYVKLQSLETALRERGIVDVKFFFDHANPKKPLTGVV